jgi:chromosome partitioning protein
MPPHIIAVANQKGGTAKTTTAVNLAAGLARYGGRRVLLVDADPQANATLATLGSLGNQEMDAQLLLTGPKTRTVTVFEVLFKRASVIEAVRPSPVCPGLDVLPADILLSEAEIGLVMETGRESRLAHGLEAVQHDYDYIVIDTPPSLGLLTINALTAAKEIFIPISMSYFALEGISLLANTIERVRRDMRHDELHIGGVICTIVDPVTVISRDVEEAVRSAFGDLVFRTTIPKAVVVETAHSAQMDIFAFAPRSKIAEAYRALVEEVVARGE